MPLLTPPALLLICWGLTFAVTGLALANPQQFDLLAVFMLREELDPRAFSRLGLAWLMLALLVLLVGDLACGWALLPRREFTTGLNANRAAELTFWVNLCFLAITALWILLTARKLGGLAQLGALALVDTLTARDLLLGNKLFTGMRLAYAALPATGCLAAGLLALPRTALNRRNRRRCRLVLGLNIAALMLLPVVMSQRLLLLQLLLSSYIVACMVRRHLFGLRWLALGALLFLAIWTLRESLTNPLILHRSALDLGLQKLAFYFTNDLWNSFAPLHNDTPRTLGGLSFGGLMELTFTDSLIRTALAERLEAAETLRGGGEFSLLTAPLVDFGPLGGAVYLFLAGFIFRLIYHLGRQRLIWAVIYAQIGAALLFSSHGAYITHQNLLFSLIVIAALARMTGSPHQATIPTPRARQQVKPPIVATPLASSSPTQFRTRRKPPHPRYRELEDA